MAKNPEVQQFIQKMTTLHGFDPVQLESDFARIQPNPRVLKLIAPPSQPGQRSWQRYRSRFLDDTRIKHGVRFWQANEAALTRARKTYGIPEEIIVAIIGVETIYGRNTGNFNTFEALATLAFHDPRRAEYFRQELEQLLLVAKENRTDYNAYTGSFAGALGMPQFMPGSIRRYAVDFDQDGRIDLKNSVQDTIGSVAHFLYQHGWEATGAITVPATLSGEPDPAWLEAGIFPSLSPQHLLTQGVDASLQGDLLSAPVTLIDLVTPGAPTEYWLGFNNFYVITRYNRSSFYAMSVFQLANAIREQHKIQQAGAASR